MMWKFYVLLVLVFVAIATSWVFTNIKISVPSVPSTQIQTGGGDSLQLNSMMNEIDNMLSGLKG